jgi:hypothetical protein
MHLDRPSRTFLTGMPVPVERLPVGACPADGVRSTEDAHPGYHNARNLSVPKAQLHPRTALDYFLAGDAPKIRPPRPYSMFRLALWRLPRACEPLFTIATAGRRRLSINRVHVQPRPAISPP